MSEKVRDTLLEKSIAVNQGGQYIIECMSYRCFLQCLAWLVNPNAKFADSQQVSTVNAHLDGMHEESLLVETHTDYYKNLFVLAGYLNSLRTE